MTKRIVSFLLVVVLLINLVPVSALAVESNNEEKILGFQTNGASFVSGYIPPATYPVSALPEAKQLDYPGFEFGGWYDNPEFTGEPVHALSDSHAGSIVLYAKWIPRYYEMSIPGEINAEQGSTVEISFYGGGFYENDQMKVCVTSANGWQMSNGDQHLRYYLSDGETQITDHTVLSTLTASNLAENKQYTFAVQDAPRFAGNYTDVLTFQLDFTTTTYQVNFHTGSGFVEKAGERITQQTVEAGTAVGQLPNAICEGKIFLGWYYDEGLTQIADSRDRILKDTELYAAYTDEAPLTVQTFSTFARATDVGGEFVISVIDSTRSLTADEVGRLVTLLNLSAGNVQEEVAITGGSGLYTLRAENGWEPGANYSLTLESDVLTFAGYADEVREYDFNVYKAPVLNVRLNDSICYIPLKDISDLIVNGQPVAVPDISTMTVGSDGTVKAKASEEVTGSFTYTGSSLAAGQQIAVYEGNAIPELTMESMAGDAAVSFFEITSANGTSYTYRGSQSKDVLFTPDILPVSDMADLDGDSNNGSITVDRSVLTFDDAQYADMGLDMDTTVDVGDFIAFYSGSLEAGMVTNYAQITAVSQVSGQYIIAYVMTTYDSMQSAMDAYNVQNMDGDTLLEGQDRQAIEQNVVQQAKDSGFAQEVVNDVAEIVMRTESYQELEEELKAATGADDIQISTFSRARNGQVKSLGASQKVEVELDHIYARLGTKLQHFENVSGVRLTLDVGVKVIIHAGNGVDLELVISAKFEQEAKVDMEINGKAVWKKWGIIPYIADYRVTASFALYDYTGIQLDVSFKTAEGDGDEETDKDKFRAELNKKINAISDELKKLMDKGTQYVSPDSDLFTRVEDHEDAGSYEVSLMTSLGERYADMLEDDADWVDILSKNIVSSHIRILLIIDIEFSIDFKIQVKVNVSAGINYWYMNAKKYIYTITVKDRKVTNEVIDLCEEQYEFSAYLMGNLGIRAGLEFSLKVGLINTKLACVGVQAEAGGYIEIWGFLYYRLQYAASQGRWVQSMGAIYLELGVYLEISFLASAIGDRFCYNPTLFEKQWPLYSVGAKKCVVDYAYTQKETEDVSLKSFVTSTELPDELFTMQYLDMTEGMDEGDDGEKVYFTSTYAPGKNFVITISNPAFRFDPTTRILSVDPGVKPQQDGEMTITWIAQKGSFLTVPLRRTVKLHWDNLRDGYYIAFDAQGGSMVPMITGKYGSEVKMPSDPKKQGYVFTGWYTDKACTVPYILPNTMPDMDTLVYAGWRPGATRVTVNHYAQQVNGTYALAETEYLDAVTGMEMIPDRKTWYGMVVPAGQTVIPAADGSSMLDYYYARPMVTIAFISDGDVVQTGKYRFGSIMPIPSITKPGYEFLGWNAPSYVPAYDATYIAEWAGATDTTYIVRYYLQNAELDGYELTEVRYLTAETGSTVTAQADETCESAGFHVSGDLPSGMVAPDGSLVLRVFYDRNAYQITAHANGGIFENEEDTLMALAGHGTTVSLEVPTRVGYGFTGWYLDEELTQPFNGIMPMADLELYAAWEAGKVNYKVEYVTRNPENTQDVVLLQNVLLGDADSEVTAEAQIFTGFELEEGAMDSQTVTLSPNGDTVITFRYVRKTYTVTYLDDEGQILHSTVVAYGCPIPTYIPERTGYHFVKWDKEIPEAMPDENLNFIAAFNITRYSIRMDLDGGYGDYPDGFTMNSEEITLTAPTREGYTFLGWTGSNGDTPELSVTIPTGSTGDRKYTANWQAISYTVTMNLNGGTGADSRTFTIESANLVLPVPSRTGYTFLGWTGFNGDTPELSVTIPTGSIGDREYTANWRENRYTIAFMISGQGATGSVESISVSGTEKVRLPNGGFNRIGYQQTGWRTAADGGTAYGLGATVSNLTHQDGATVTLYPKWTANTYTLYLDGDGIKSDSSRSCTYDSYDWLPTLQATGYNFLGWGTSPYGQAVVFQPGARFSNLTSKQGGTFTLYAKWKAKNTFTFSSYGPYRVNDEDDDTVKFHFFLTDEAGSGIPSSGHGQWSQGTDLRWTAIKRDYTSATITLTYTVEEIDDGYQEFYITGRTPYTNDWNTLASWQSDAGGGGAHTESYTKTINLSNVNFDCLCLILGANGKKEDDWNLRNFTMTVTFQ